VANLVEQAAAGVLATSDVNLLDYPGYRAAGRHMLGVLRRTMKSARHRRELESGETPITEQGGDTMRHHVPGPTGALPDRIRSRLEEKIPDWQKLRLDLDVVQRIQEAVFREFCRVVRDHSELLPRIRSKSQRP